MKKLLLLVAFGFIGTMNVVAQNVEIGVKGGINIANVLTSSGTSFDPVTAFNFGVMSEFKISEKFSFQPEVLFSGQGYSFGKDDLVALNYVNVPLMAKYYLYKGLSIEAGPQVGFLLSAKMGSLDLKDSFKKVDFGANVGLGYKLENGLNFGVRYNLGLSDINNVSNNPSSFKNGVFQASIGYFIF